MDKSVQEYYDNQFEMFNTQGWKDFEEDAVNALANATSSSDFDCTTNDEWQYRRGELSKIRALAGYQDFIKRSYNAVLKSELEAED